MTGTGSGLPDAPDVYPAGATLVSVNHSAPHGHTGTVTINLDNVRHNVETLRSATKAQVMAVVKADAYGHGLVAVSQAALAAGATWLGTAQVGEALQLRDAGFDCRILTWLHAPAAKGQPGAIDAAVAGDIDVSVSDARELAEVRAAAQRHHRVPRVHLKVDTGLGRNGTRSDNPAELNGFFDAALASERDGAARIVGVWSHFACADEPEHPATDAQLAAFKDAVTLLESKGARLEVRHLANSAGILTRPDSHFDLVRAGIAMYGASPIPTVKTAKELDLKPVMTVSAPLALVKKLGAGQGVSYGHTYVTERETTVGLVPLGYADGVPRIASGKGPVCTGGRNLTVAGRICMDQFVIDLGPDSDDAAGQDVVLFGQDGPDVEEWARAAQSISYELFTSVQPRIPRLYVGQR